MKKLAAPLLLLPVLAAAAEIAAPAPAPAPAPAAAERAGAGDRAAPAPRRPAPPFTEADLAPLPPAGDLARAREAYEASRYDAAAEQLARSRQPAARYLRARALVEAGRGAEAVLALARLERDLPEIADRIAYWRGRAEDLAAHRDAAAAAYAEVRPGSLLWGQAHLARARALQALGERKGALDALAPILALPAPDDVVRGDAAAEALLLAGQLHAAGGDGELAAARRAFVDCWAAHPLSAAAATCSAELGRLPGSHGAPPSPEDAVRRAEALLDENRNAAALAELAKLAPTLPAPAPGEALACRARFALGKAYRKERQHSRAVEALGPVVERCDDPQLRVRAVYFLASASSIVAPDDAIAWYRALARDYPGHPLADDALFYAADLLARADRRDEARAALAELVERYPRGDFRAEALFRMAWLDRQAGEVERAVASLARLEREYEASDPYEHARAAYWRARLVAERDGEGDAAAAAATWRLLAERYPADYYGLLARTRLEESAPGSAPPWPHAEAAAPAPLRYDAGPLRDDRHFRAGVLLLRMGMQRPAADELAAVDRKLLSAGGEPLLLAAELLDRAGDHKTSHRLVRSLGRAALRQRPEGAALRIWRVAYPLAYRDQVLRWAAPAGVPPDLLLALMREESGLDPTVVSGAGAVGLTQLMLPTAQQVARRLHMGRVGSADLMQPPIAIRIGATYFGGLLERYRSEALALAAYNVGEVPVRRWLAERGTLPLDAFVEEIPVQETRGYVKRVLRSYAAYRFLYGGAERPVLLGQVLSSPRGVPPRPAGEAVGAPTPATRDPAAR